MLENNGQIGINRLVYFVNSIYSKSGVRNSLSSIAEQYFYIKKIQTSLGVPTSPKNIFQGLVRLNDPNIRNRCRQLYLEQEVPVDIEVDISYDTTSFSGYDIETNIENLNEVSVRDEYPKYNDSDLESSIKESIEDDVSDNQWWVEEISDVSVKGQWSLPYLEPSEDEFLYSYDDYHCPDTLHPNDIQEWIKEQMDSLDDGSDFTNLEYEQQFLSDLLTMINIDQSGIEKDKDNSEEE